MRLIMRKYGIYTVHVRIKPLPVPRVFGAQARPELLQNGETSLRIRSHAAKAGGPGFDPRRLPWDISLPADLLM